MQRNSAVKILERLTGTESAFSIENRIFNGVALISLVGLIFFALVNIVMGLVMPAILMTIVLLIQAYLYYLARLRKKFNTGVIVYAVTGQLCLILNYYFNSGISGPTLFGFFLTLQLVLTVTPKKHHLLWLLIHVGIIAGLLVFQYLEPDFIAFSYHSQQEQVIDNFSTVLIVLLSIFWITGYLKHSYEKQRTIIETQNRRLEEMNAEKNKIFSIVAHDLQSPLATIQSYLELIIHYPEEGINSKVHNEQLLNLTKGTSDMLANLLSWSKNQMEGSKTYFRSVNLYQLVETVLSVQESMAQNKNIAITSAVDPEVMVYADREMLALVIRNLINNAIKFSPSGSSVFIHSSVQGKNVMLSVEDQGIGLTASQEEKLFTLKVTSNYGTNREKGTGIGLSLCKDLMNKMYGNIFYKKGKNGGSVFTITIQVANEESVDVTQPVTTKAAEV